MKKRYVVTRTGLWGRTVNVKKFWSKRRAKKFYETNAAAAKQNPGRSRMYNPPRKIK